MQSTQLFPNMKALLTRMAAGRSMVLFITAGAVQAQSVITWGPAQTISGDADISAAYPVDRAYSFGSSDPLTVNGVTFMSFFAQSSDTFSANIDDHEIGFGSASPYRLDALLFGETQSRVVISCKALDADKVVERAKLLGVPAIQIGKVGGGKLTVKTAAGEFSAPLAELHDDWWNSIDRAMA
jgi:hypothetical protein